MKKAVLGILITAAAGFAGAMAGLLLVSIPIGLGVWMFQNNNTQGPNIIVSVMVWIAPLLGAVVGIRLGWRAVIRQPQHEAERERLRGLCQRCRYDLHHNTTGRCPECGKVIPAKQRAFLRREAR